MDKRSDKSPVEGSNRSSHRDQKSTCDNRDGKQPGEGQYSSGKKEQDRRKPINDDFKWMQEALVKAWSKPEDETWVEVNRPSVDKLQDGWEEVDKPKN